MAGNKNSGPKGYTDIISPEMVKAAIVDSGGMISIIAGKLEVQWHTAKKYVHKWPEVLQFFHEERMRTNDNAIGALRRAINDGDTKVAMWWLSKMESNIFGDKLKVEGSFDLNINFNVGSQEDQDELNKLINKQ